MKKKRRTSNAQAIAARINSQMKGTVVGFASDPKFEIEKIPCGSLAVERITGGGLPRGRHVELYGDYSSGKSYIMYRTMALAQQRGETCALVDSEKVFEASWFQELGGDPDELIIFRPKTAERLIKIIQLLASEDDDNPAVDVVGIDSVASLLPQEELNKDVEEGDDRTAGRARMMSRLLRRVTNANDHTLFLWSNQLIDQVGGYGGTTTPGGRALKFYASVRIEMRKMDRVKKPRKVVSKGKVVTKDVVVGHWVNLRAEKQKTSRPEKQSMLFFDYERRRIDPEYEILHLGLEDGLITRSGNTFSYEDSDGKLWSGTESRFRAFLRDNEDLAEELSWAISENTRQQVSNDEEGDDDDG